MAIQEAAEQQEIVEDLQFVENFIPAANECLLVHQNSCEFGIAEASLLSPLIFSPPDQQANAVNNNDNDKRPSLTSLESMKSYVEAPEEPEDRHRARMMRISTATNETIQYIDGSSAVVVNPPQQRFAAVTFQSGITDSSASTTSSPRELVTFASE